MAGRLKIILGLAIAVTCVFAGTARAEFHTAAEPVVIQGGATNTHHLTNGTFDITCSTVNLIGTESAATNQELRLHATAEGCHVIILFTFSGTVNFNSCDYEFDDGGDLAIACDEGDKIVVSSVGCTVEIGPQEITGAVSYENESETIAVTANASGIAYNQFGAGCGTASGTNGTYTGKSVLEAFEFELTPTELRVE